MSGKQCCATCGEPCTQACGHCKKVSYCSKEHQKNHRKIHKPNCFPAMLIKHPDFGEHWVTTRDISPGEIIFNEYPLVYGPCGSIPGFRLLCIACFKYLEKRNTCTLCGWPVCTVECQNLWYGGSVELIYWLQIDAMHQNLECPILTRNRVSPRGLQVDYQHIFVLRCLLQKDLSPENWTLMNSLESHVAERSQREDCKKATSDCVTFIQDSCKLDDFDLDTVNYVLGAVQFNSYPLNRYMTGTGLGMQLFYKLGKVNHSCVPNTESIDLEQPPGHSPLSRGLSLTATVNIAKGQSLAQLYGDTLQGTYDRQQMLRSEYYFTCHCSRCVDPTELNTFYSGIKCQRSECLQGYLLPIDPLDKSSVWECRECKATQSYDSFIAKIVDDISQDMKSVYTEIQKGTRSLKQQAELNDKLKQFLQRHEGKHVHPNHFTLIPIKLRYLQETIELLHFKRKSKQKDVKDIAEDMLKLALGVMKVFDVLMPGNSSERGIVQNFIDECNSFL